MPLIHRILATTALCLAAAGLNSCVSQNCRSIWRGAYEVDKVWWIEGVRDNTTPIYRYNGGHHEVYDHRGGNSHSGKQLRNLVSSSGVT